MYNRLSTFTLSTLDVSRTDTELRQSPRPQRQRLDPRHRRLDVSIERHNPDDDTDDVHHIVPIRLYIAGTSTGLATVSISLQCAGKGLRNDIALEKLDVRDLVGWLARGGSEIVDKAKNEVARESTAEIRNTGRLLVRCEI